ncbi:MAG: IS66 family transposase [Kiritimatiellia bacterium]
MNDARLQAENELLREELKRKDARIAQLEGSLRLLEQRLNQLLRMHYGRKSEKLQDGQIELALGMAAPAPVIPEDPTPAPVPPPELKVRRKRGRRVIPDDLPEVVQVHDLPAEEKTCEHCGKEMTLIGADEAVKIGYEPARLHKLVHRQLKYACKCEHCAQSGIGVHTAPRPAEAVPGCIADASLMAHIIVAKTRDHLPLNRLSEQFSRLGWGASRATLCNIYLNAARAVEPLYECLKESVLACPVIHHDDTPVRERQPGSGRCSLGRIWVTAGRWPRGMWSSITPRRGKRRAAGVSSRLHGHDSCRRLPGLQPVVLAGRVPAGGCLAHTRRYFYNAWKTGESMGMKMVILIRALFHLERRADELQMNADERLAPRLEHAVPVVAEIRERLDDWKKPDGVLPRSLLGKAVTYADNQWGPLTLFLKDGRVPIHNNRAERMLRPFAIGRKNWLFFGAASGGHAAAILHSLAATCVLYSVNPEAYSTTSSAASWTTTRPGLANCCRISGVARTAAAAAVVGA